ncbi:hypothetical protein M413DRAFT_402070 [Hebeloma cylindrosporum]|uniref:Uncharacterized protein n=1 Tax=Hebeloma cylindrosporum TaxID=76867 RepID=A0A0C3C358_HEBCY|nr:hypothetical protein M413DRAFT_402070 [Hebeloma cylindrosporum h7]
MTKKRYMNRSSCEKKRVHLHCPCIGPRPPCCNTQQTQLTNTKLNTTYSPPKTSTAASHYTPLVVVPDRTKTCVHHDHIAAQVEQDGRRLEHDEIITLTVHEHRYSTIGIHGEEPGLLLRVFRDVDVMHTK